MYLCQYVCVSLHIHICPTTTLPHHSFNSAVSRQRLLRQSATIVGSSLTRLFVSNHNTLYNSCHPIQSRKITLNFLRNKNIKIKAKVRMFLLFSLLSPSAHSSHRSSFLTPPLAPPDPDIKNRCVDPWRKHRRRLVYDSVGTQASVPTCSC